MTTSCDPRQPQRLLIVDDDPASVPLLRAMLELEPIEVVSTETGKDAIARVAAERPDLVILALELRDMDGLRLMSELRMRDPALKLIVIPEQKEIRKAVRAARLGAFDFLARPFDRGEVVAIVRAALDRGTAARSAGASDAPLADVDGLVARMGSSPQVMRLAEQVQRLADSSFPVLIQGESGTGKELVAQALHRQSPRHARPFVVIDCDAFPAAAFESAQLRALRPSVAEATPDASDDLRFAVGGTLLLDEVAHLPLPLQPKLLRPLESRERGLLAADADLFDVRFLLTTTHDLAACVKAGSFRGDLYVRLAQFSVQVPPLRERPTDILLLARRFLEEACTELHLPKPEIAPAALLLLQEYSWPGNARELRYVIRQAALSNETASLERALLAKAVALRNELSGSASSSQRATGCSLKDIADAAAQEAERSAICEALRAAKGNQRHTARALQIDYKTLHNRLKRYGIQAKDFDST